MNHSQNEISRGASTSADFVLGEPGNAFDPGRVYAIVAERRATMSPFAARRQRSAHVIHKSAPDESALALSLLSSSIHGTKNTKRATREMPLEYHPPYDLMLCGGGVVGLSIAYECASNGWKVLLVDSGQVGKESSWAGAGILPAGATIEAHDPTEQLRALSHRLHPEWSQRLLEQTGIDNEFRRCGGLYLGMSPAERATLAANQMWWDEHGVGFESWSAHELATRLPFMHEQVAVNERLRAWYVPEDCRVRNPRHIRALVAACDRLGVTMLENTCIDNLETHADRIVSTHSGGREFHAEKFCVTSGAWASQLLKPIGIETGILPVRGQMVLYKLDKPLFSMVINEGHRYLVPRDDGYVLAGSCEEEVGFDHRTTDEMIEPLKQWAVQICPVLSQAVVARVWSGLRPGSFDTLPYLGTLHPFENGFVAAGHFRHGLHWSTATGLLMYQWMSGQKTEIDLMPFRVQRGQTLGMQLQPTNHNHS